MAVYGAKGIWYAEAKKEDGVVVGYKGAKKLGMITEYNFEATVPDANPLYADNQIAEMDAGGASGGTFTGQVTYVSPDDYKALYGIEPDDETLTEADGVSSEAPVKVLKFTGNEVSTPVGLAVIEDEQVNNVRNKFRAIIFREATAVMPNESATTMGESIDWQVKEMSFNVMGRDAKGNAWKKIVECETEEAAIKYIEKEFKVNP